MGLELRRKDSEWWYGTFKVNGREFTKNLGVKVEGIVPPTLRQIGDAVFERSRIKALAAAEKFQDELGRRRASLRDFHSFRVTWVTIALTAGVPLEIVQRVTGHRTAGIVMRHYFQRGREDFRRTLASKLPVPLGGDVAPPKPVESAELIERVRGMTDDNWENARAELLDRLAPSEPMRQEAEASARQLTPSVICENVAISA